MTAIPDPASMTGRERGASPRQGFAKSVAERLFGKSRRSHADRANYAHIGEFLAEHALSPSPRNYDIAYRCLVEQDPQAIDTIIALQTARAGLTDDSLAEAFGRPQPAITADMLTQFVNRAQSYVSQTAEIIDESQESVRSFGDSLELVELPAGLAGQIVDLTKSMIVKSRRFEVKLRKMDSEIGELRLRLDDARKDAMLDPMTGLPNRRAFLEKLNEAISALSGTEDNLCVAYCDIDHFKVINDTYGHEVGDRVIQFVGRRIQESATDTMSVARFGGEEFVVLFERSSLSDAVDHMNGLRIDISTRKLVCRDSGEPLGRVSFSAGVAAHRGSVDANGLIKAADQALYRAKSLGRDRVEVPPDPSI